MIGIKCNFPNISFQRLEYPIIFIYILSIIEELLSLFPEAIRCIS